MKETSVNKLPYAEDSDPPDYPTQGQELAETLDTLKWGSRNLKPTCGVKAASEDLTLTTSYQDVPGATLEITPAVASILKVTAIFDFELRIGDANSDNFCLGTVKVDSETEVSRLAKLGAVGSVAEIKDLSARRATVVEVYALSLSAAAHTIKLRAKRQAATGSICRQAGAGDPGGGTCFLYELTAS